MATNWQIGDLIQHRWQLHKILRGGMGIVYVVYDREHRAPYAAKTFQDEIFARSAGIADRFRQEALTWINLDAHQNIAQAHFVQIIEGKTYLFMEYVSGGDLSSWIGTLRLPKDLPQILRFAIQFCDGMSHALAKGVVAHRDIKPQNCLITQDKILKVTDFGLARAVATQAGRGGRGGTPEYMPPEQWDNFEQANERSDIYSFGAMLHEMLTGQPPFGKRRERGGRDLEFRHKNEMPPPLNSQLPTLNSVAQSCLAKDPSQRLADFGTVRSRLAKIYKDLTGEQVPQPIYGIELNLANWNNKGLSLNQLGQHKEALDCYERAIEINAGVAETWTNKGNGLHELGRLEQALDCYERALEIAPGIAEIWSNKGVIVATLGRLDEALNCHDRALEINPRSERAWFNKAVVLSHLGRFEESLECYNRTLELDPRFEQAWLEKGATLYGQARLEEALICYTRALEVNPRDAKAWFDKGHILVKLRRLEEALDCYNYALEINPRLRDAWYNKGVVLISGFQRYREALGCFEEAHRLGDPNAAQAIAVCQQSLGQR